jgi:hypothetical protein
MSGSHLTSHLTSHQIGSKAGTQIVKDSLNAGIDWPYITIACETAVAVVVAAIIQMTESNDGIRLATELVDVALYLMGSSSISVGLPQSVWLLWR